MSEPSPGHPQFGQRDWPFVRGERQLEELRRLNREIERISPPFRYGSDGENAFLQEDSGVPSGSENGTPLPIRGLIVGQYSTGSPWYAFQQVSFYNDTVSLAGVSWTWTYTGGFSDTATFNAAELNGNVSVPWAAEPIVVNLFQMEDGLTWGFFYEPSGGGGGASDSVQINSTGPIEPFELLNLVAGPNIVLNIGSDSPGGVPRGSVTISASGGSTFTTITSDTTTTNYLFSDTINVNILNADTINVTYITVTGPSYNTGPESFTGGFYWPESISSPSTGTINNYTLSTDNTIQDFSLSSGGTTLTGMVTHSAPQTDGLFFWLVNLNNGSGGNLTLKNQNSGSTSTNQFITPNGQDFVVTPGYSVPVKYDGTAGKYRLLVLPNLTTNGSDSTGTPQTDINTLRLTFAYPGLIYTPGTGANLGRDTVSLGGGGTTYAKARFPSASTMTIPSGDNIGAVSFSLSDGSYNTAGYDPNGMLPGGGPRVQIIIPQAGYYHFFCTSYWTSTGLASGYDIVMYIANNTTKIATGAVQNTLPATDDTNLTSLWAYGDCYCNANDTITVSCANFNNVGNATMQNACINISQFP